MEIERKFLLDELPNIPAISEVEIHQGYVSISPEVRVRSYRVISGENEGYEDYKLTIKSGGDLVRAEIETTIPKKFFDKVAAFIGRPLISKRYFKYQYGGHTLECSIVDEGTDHSFIYGEVEFASVEEAKNYQWPFQGAKDITYNQRYKMKNYWATNSVQNDGECKD